MLYTKKDFIERNPNTTQRLVNAFVKALKWLADARRPRTSRRSVPPEYHLGDRPLYIRAVQNSLESYSRDGVVAAGGHGERRSTC